MVNGCSQKKLLSRVDSEIKPGEQRHLVAD